MIDEKTLKSCGYVPVENFLDVNKCRELINQISDFDESALKEVRVDRLPSELRIWNAEKVFPLVQAFLQSEQIKSFSRQIGMEPSFCIYNKIIPGKVGSGGSWHRDTRFQNQFKCILYLSDCHEGNGNFAYVRRSQKDLSPFIFTRVLDFFRKPRYSFLDKIFSKLASNIYGDAGTAMFVNTKGIHRGTPLIKGERHALTIYYDNGVNLSPNG
jgi:hypothetical protein